MLRSRRSGTGRQGGGRSARGAEPAPDGGFRLPEHVRPTHYRVHLTPDLDQGSYRGEAEIQVDVARAVDAIELHAVDLTIEEAEVGCGRVASPASVVPHPARETVALRLPRRLAAGAARIRLRFAGTLQQSLRGFYGAASNGRRYGFTQLEATDARRFFPCFDEPGFKARFSFAVTARARHAVISNSPVARVVDGGDGWKTVHFAPTPPLSTYLCALAVGELECSEERRVGRTPIRVWHVPGKGHLTGFALEAAVESLSRLERYFGLAYPYQKLDLVAVPDFEAGAMENAGAVFFRETLLLVDPRTITLAEQKRVAEVVAHELAHMWYGDLVTMAWWNDLWLNEAFATWMAFRIVDEWRPDWRMQNNFEHHRSAALALDALANTHPIYVEVRDPAQATENFDAITYEKGAAVVRMVETYLGASVFRAGVRRYIRRHREGNARAADLWRALEEVSGRRVNRVVRAWIEQPGFPLLAVQRRDRRGRASLDCRQRRFFSDPKTRAGTQLWPIPLAVKIGGGRAPRVARHLVTKRRQRVALGRTDATAWYYANAAEGGFYRPLHDAANLSALAASPIPSALTAVERMGLIGHQWAAVRAGHVAIESFLDLADDLGGETDHDVLSTLAGPLRFIEDELLDAAGPSARPLFQRWLAEMFRGAWEELGWVASRGEADDRRLRRAAVLRIAGEIAEDPAIAAGAERRFPAYLRRRTSIDANLTDSLVSIVARRGGAEEFERYLRAAETAKTPQDRRRFQCALAEFARPALVDRTLSLTVTEAIATQDVGIVLVRLLANRAARARTWEFITKRWPALSRRLPPMMVSRLVDATPMLKTKEYERDVAAFFRAHPVPTARRALQQALERFGLNREFRRRAARGLLRWLKENG